jgi:hypothetical protein
MTLELGLTGGGALGGGSPSVGQAGFFDGGAEGSLGSAEGAASSSSAAPAVPASSQHSDETSVNDTPPRTIDRALINVTFRTELQVLISVTKSRACETEGLAPTETRNFESKARLGG